MHILFSLEIMFTGCRVWAERLRYWTSEHVMRPLLQQMASSSKLASEALQRCQSPTLILSVTPLLPASGQWSDLQIASDDEFNQAITTLQILLASQSQAPTLYSTQTQNAASISAAQGATRAALRAVKHHQQITQVRAMFKIPKFITFFMLLKHFVTQCLKGYHSGPQHDPTDLETL